MPPRSRRRASPSQAGPSVNSAASRFPRGMDAPPTEALRVACRCRSNPRRRRDRPYSVGPDRAVSELRAVPRLPSAWRATDVRPAHRNVRKWATGPPPAPWGGIGVSAAAQIALDVAALSPAEARQEATRRMSPMLEGLRKCLNDEGRDQDRRAAAIAEKGSLVWIGCWTGCSFGRTIGCRGGRDEREAARAGRRGW